MGESGGSTPMVFSTCSQSLLYFGPRMKNQSRKQFRNQIPLYKVSFFFSFLFNEEEGICLTLWLSMHTSHISYTFLFYLLKFPFFLLHSQE